METTSLASPAPSPAAPPPLRLLSLGDANIGLDDVIVRPRKNGLLFIAIVALAISGWTTWRAVAGTLDWGIAAICIAALLSAPLLLYWYRRRDRRPGAWQMAIGRDRVLIRYRGVIEAGVPAGAPQVIELPLAHVLGVRQMRRVIRQVGGNDSDMLTYTYLDFRVRDRDLRPLQAVLMERQRKDAGTWFTRRDPTVAVTADGVLRVETSFQGSDTQPRMDEILRLLGERVPRDADGQELLDIRNPATLLPEDKEKGLRAVGETSMHRALLLAEEMDPHTSRAELQQRVADLVACPAPSASAPPDAPAGSDTIELTASAETTELTASAAVSGLPDATSELPVPGTQQQPEPASASTSVDEVPGDVALPSPRFLRPSEAEIRADEQLVRPNAVFSLVLGLALLGTAGWMGWKYWAGTIHWGWAAGIGAFSLLFGGGLLQGWRLSFRREAWVMAIGPERILVRVRSYLHEHLTADDPQVVELPLAHLVSVRLRKVERQLPGKGRSRNYKFATLLEFRTRGTALLPLGEALSQEYAPRPNGSVTPPVVRVDGDVLTVEIGPIRPDRDEVLRLLGERMTREDDVEEVVEIGGHSQTRLARPPARK
ncbi:MAG TPA: hypothetical protein VLK84_22205 [Longimicrobium sp.]|nr:hypothetical protein [Longimicrobium sp.]